MKIDVSFLPAIAAAFMLSFARIGTMVMLLPGLGELTVPTRVRLTLALVLTAVIMPLHRSAYQVDLHAFVPVVQLLFQELLIGAVLGLLSRLTVSALQVAGMVVAQQMGLGFVTAVDPTQGQQGMLVGNFLAVLGLTMIFATDLHHLVIAALNDSYVIFRPGEMPVLGDVANALTTTVAGAFRIGVQIAAPFLVFGLLFNMGLGILSKLMPQMQVFFVGMPLSILIGFLILHPGGRRHDDDVPRLCRWRAAPAGAAGLAAHGGRRERFRSFRGPNAKRLDEALQRGDVAKSAGGLDLVRDRRRPRIVLAAFSGPMSCGLTTTMRGIVANAHQIPVDGRGLIAMAARIEYEVIAAIAHPARAADAGGVSPET